MTSTDGKRTLLLATSALGAVAFASAAFAQSTDTSNSKAVEEVVVTATRQTSTVNKVALSVSAVTQKNLDQQGIRSVADLSTQVPGFTYRVTGGDSIPQLSLRGPRRQRHRPRPRAARPPRASTSTTSRCRKRKVS